MQKLAEKMSKQELEQAIDEHDCTLTGEDGCICSFYRQILEKRLWLPTLKDKRYLQREYRFLNN